ncbi:MAG: zinc ribbon domain-containing protein [Armatimonadetes bacterium]|nr:zinc ribbon domain-containing protein [Armatimonadota bacterium]
MVQCPNCGKENPAEANFCMYCGTNLKRSTEPLTSERLLVMHHELLYLKEDAKDAQKSSLTAFVAGVALLIISHWLADYGDTEVPVTIWILFIILMLISVVEGMIWWRKYGEYLSRLEGLKIYTKARK